MKGSEVVKRIKDNFDMKLPEYADDRKLDIDTLRKVIYYQNRRVCVNGKAREVRESLLKDKIVNNSFFKV